MKAVGYYQSLPHENPESLVDVQVPAPTPGPNDLVVRVKAISVNPVDTKQRMRAQSKDGTPVILGYDVSGVVEQVGSAVTQWKTGDEVFYAGDISRPGGNSELHAVDARIVGHKPKSLSHAESAALPLTALTAYEALHERLQVKEGQTLLILGGAGGVGSMTIQMAKLAGLTVIATASRPESAEWVKKIGATHVVDHTKPLAPQLEALGIKTVDAIFNTANTEEYWEQMAEIIKPFGRIASIVEAHKPLDLTLLMMKSVTFGWELMFTRSLFQTPDMSEQSRILTQVAEWIDRGDLVTTASNVLTPITAKNLRKAHGLLESRKAVGKVVLEGWN